MKTIHVNESNLTSIQQTAPASVMALGFFDGVHIGHQKVIETAKAEANRRGLPLSLMSFPTHPKNVLSKGKQNIGSLMTLDTKQAKLQQLGVELFYLVDFTMSFAGLSPNEFVQQYLINLKVKHAVAGFDYRFAKMGVGKLNDIPTISCNQISITEVECTDHKKEKISSTAIRQRLQHGLVHEIPNFLGRSYRNKARVNDRNLTIIDNTMTPVDGYYRVLLVQNQTRMIAEVILRQDGDIQCLQFPNLQGEVSIEWLEHRTPLQTTNIV